PATAAQITGFADALRRVPGVTTVDAPVASRDGTVELVPFTFAAKGHGTRPAAKQVEDLAAAERRQGLDVELSGTMFDHISIGGHEAPGIAVAVIVLLVAFGSAVAMGLPILTALFGIGIGMAGVTVWSHFTPTPDFAVQIASMIGIGVGID